MHKSKLQELCHRNLWPAPTYDTAKVGPDHSPRFKSTVVAGDRCFVGADDCRTAKSAQTDAAKVALHHLAASASHSSTSVLHGSSSDASVCSQASQASKSAIVSNLLGLEVSYKGPLQNYTQKRSLRLPAYESIREGSHHALRFKSKVTIDGQIFESPRFFNTLKEAENAAAKVALESLCQESNEEVAPTFFKTLLQELVQKEHFTTPVYQTVMDGPSHMPTFSSTVEIEGEKFVGIRGMTKKQAEQNAAQVAWCTLKERKSSNLARSLMFNVQIQEDFDIVDLNALPTKPSDLQQQEAFSSTSTFPRFADEDISTVSLSDIVLEDTDSNGSSTDKQLTSDRKFTAGSPDELLLDFDKWSIVEKKATTVEPDTNPSFSGRNNTNSSFIGGCNTVSVCPDELPKIDKLSIVEKEVTTVETDTNPTSFSGKNKTNSSFIGGCSTVSVYPDELPKIDKLSIVEKESTTVETDTNPTSFSSKINTISTFTGRCSKVTVYPRTSSIVLPEGAVELPMSNETWVAFSEEEQG